MVNSVAMNFGVVNSVEVNSVGVANSAEVNSVVVVVNFVKQVNLGVVDLVRVNFGVVNSVEVNFLGLPFGDLPVVVD